MTGTFEWADYLHLLERSFFEHTKELYELEKVLKTPIPDSMHWTRRFEYPWALNKIIESPQLRSFVDVGSGATALQFKLGQLGNRVAAIDPDPEAIAWLNHRRADWAMQPKAVLGGFPVLPFKDDEFDAGICISVLEHLPKDQILPSIRELIRVSRKEVLITMDVELGKQHPRQMDYVDLSRHMQALNIAIPQPNNRITFQMDGYVFGVACIHVVK